MTLKTQDIVILVVGTVAAFAIPYWAIDLGVWWSVAIAVLYVVIAVTVRLRSGRSPAEQ